MGQMWDPAAMGPRDAGVGIPGQGMGQGGKKGANPFYFSP